MDSKFNGQQEALYFEKPSFQFLLLKKLFTEICNSLFHEAHTREYIKESFLLSSCDEIYKIIRFDRVISCLIKLYYILRIYRLYIFLFIIEETEKFLYHGKHRHRHRVDPQNSSFLLGIEASCRSDNWIGSSSIAHSINMPETRAINSISTPTPLRQSLRGKDNRSGIPVSRTRAIYIHIYIYMYSHDITVDRHSRFEIFTFPSSIDPV